MHDYRLFFLGSYIIYQDKECRDFGSVINCHYEEIKVIKEGIEDI